MPRNVRNFWIELDVDGKRTPVATGPVKRDGGFSLTILQRHEGDIVRALKVWGRVNSAGQIVLSVEPNQELVVRVPSGDVQIRTVR